MKGLERDLQFLLKNLKLLVQKAERIEKKLDKLEKSESVMKPKPKTIPRVAKQTVAEKPKRETASATVLDIITKSRGAVHIADLKEETGFKDNNIRMIIYRLKKRGKIKSVRKGVYKKG